MPANSLHEPIAIIGIGCRLPGGANNAQSYWQMLLNGVDAVREISPDRWDLRAYFDPEQGKPGKTYSKWAGLIENIDQFDPQFFGISRREASFIDPQHRMLLEAAWEALEDAGQQVDITKGDDTGVFVGISTSDYANLQIADSSRSLVDAYSATGVAMSIAANRISYALNLQGPSLAVDTACSSSLVAVHLACQAIWNHECHRAIAAGVNCLITPHLFIAFSSMGMLSPDGRCKAFDASANGFVRGEGVGAVCLKPLSAALAAGDPIYALIRSTAVNQDGRTTGMTVPSRSSQEALVLEACRLAGVSPHEIQYVEAHGTGTAVGDPIETSALGTVLGAGRPAGEECLIGSVKANIGHLESGAGIAGIIKAALCLKHGMVPPNLHFKNPNPAIDFEKLRLKVPVHSTPLKRDAKHRLLACINSFGFGGTNAHAILEGPPAAAAPARHTGTDGRLLMLPLYARGGDTALDAVAKSFHDHIASVIADDSISLTDICAAAARRRTHHEQRLVVQGADKKEMLASLASHLRGEAVPGLSVGRAVKNAKAVFVFSGQGPQWWAMGRELMQEEPVFRQMLQACDDELIKLGGWSLMEELGRDEQTSRMNETEFAQPAIFALQVALAALWKSWGIQPSAVVGHSVGEVAAAHEAGVLDLPAAIRVIYHRGRCMEHAPERGKMIAAALTREEALEKIAAYGGRLSLAAVNGHRMVSISGDADAVDELFQQLEQLQLYVRQVPVNYAFHSAHMDPVQAELAAALNELRPQTAKLPIYSTVTGQQAEGVLFDADYWWQNVRQTVLFAPAIDALIAAGHIHFVEISAHPVLSGSISECLAAADCSGLVQPSLRRQKPERATMLESLGSLHAHGHTVRWETFYPTSSSLIPIPRYPWQKDSYWEEPELTHRRRIHPQLNPLIRLPLNTIHPTWESSLEKRVISWLSDHRVGQYIIFPGAAYLEMALAAGKELYGGQSLVIEEFDIKRACGVPAGEEAPLIQIAIQPAESSFIIQSSLTLEPPNWIKHVSGRLRTEVTPPPPPQIDMMAVKSRCTVEMDAAAFYQAASRIELNYGPLFQAVVHSWSNDDEALARIEMPEKLLAELDVHQLHPVLLDCCFQAAIAIPADGLYLPSRIERLRCYAKPPARLFAYIRKTKLVPQKITVGDLLLIDDEGNVLVEITGYACKFAGAGSLPGSGVQAEWLYDSQWQIAPLADKFAMSRTDHLPAPATMAAALRKEAARFAASLGLHQRYQDWQARLHGLCHAYVLSAFKTLGWQPRVRDIITAESLIEQMRVIPDRERMVHQLLALLEQGGVLKTEHSGRNSLQKSWVVVEKPAALNIGKTWRDIVFHFPAFHPELILLDRCAGNLAAVLRGEVAGEKLLSANMLEHFQASSVFTRVANHLVAEAVTAALARLPEGRRVRILEIGAGTGGVTAHVLHCLPSAVTDYCYSDFTNDFFNQAEQKFGDYPFVRYQVFDPGLPPEDQGFADDRFDIILASNALSLADDVQTALLHTRRLLASEGLLLVVETDRPSPWHHLVLGMNERWWSSQDTALRPCQPLLKAADWRKLLAAADFARIEAVSDITSKEQPGQVLLLARGPEIAPASLPTAESSTTGNSGWVLFADQGGVADALAATLRDQGGNCLLVKPGPEYQRISDSEVRIRPSEREDYAKLFSAGQYPEHLLGVIHLWSLDAPAGSDVTTAEIASAQSLVCHSPLCLVQALSAAGLSALPRLSFITRGSQPVGQHLTGVSMARSPLAGLVRVIMNEHPDLSCRCIDLDPAATVDETPLLVSELLSESAEDEIAWRAEARYVHRLVRSSLDLPPQLPLASLKQGQCYRLESAKPGSLDKLVFHAKDRIPPGRGQVEIEICAAALNFRDVMKALGIYPAEAEDAMLLGDECAGRIVRVGEGVTQFQPGDEVMALAVGCFSTHVTTMAHAVLPKPAHLTMEEAATVMVTYLTASYALIHQGRMTKGERVLIHAGTGGVGQAAIRLAQAAGAEIFATAGSEEKRSFLRKIGVPHVLDSRTLTFAEEIMKITRDEGIDIVLNSLAGEAIHQSLSVLRQYGRFLEIGKRDIYEDTKVGLFAFRKNLSYHAIDLGHALDPRNSKGLLRSMRQLITSRKLPPLPFRTFALSDAAHAFRYITQARQIGKVVLNVADASTRLTADVPPADLSFDPQSSCLVVGGLGGFGLALSLWLVEKGTRHIVLTGRSGLSTDEARDGVARMQAAGAEVTVIASDASSPESVATLLKQIRDTLPPLRSIFHVAMVLDDSLINQLTPERFEKVTTPKINGAWNLHQQTQDLPLNHFVMFSSVSSLIGSPGQANYAAANAFLDALAHHRHLQGMPALTVNWGVMAGVGYVARHKKLEEHFERIGWAGLTPAQTLPILGRLLRQPAISQMMVSRIDWAKWAGVTPRLISTPRYAQLTTEDALRQNQSQDANWLRDSVLKAAPHEQPVILENFLREQVARVLRTSPSKIDPKRPLNEYGLDSLMAVELIHQIESQAGIAIPTGQLMGGAPTVNKLSEILLHHLTGGKGDAASRMATANAAVSLGQNAQTDFVQDADLTAAGIPFANAPVDLRQIHQPQAVFLTGVLDYLGAYLLRGLLRQTTANVYCLIKADDTSAALQQISHHLRAHGCWEDAFLARLIPVLGELGLPCFGLEETAFGDLAQTIDAIYHTTAQINHLASYAQLRPMNVDGTLDIIRLAAARRLKPVHYLSSISVLAARTGSQMHEDTPLDAPANLLVGYNQSRWVSEHLFLQARQRGLPVNIYRPGLICGDNLTGICPPDDLIWLFVKTCIEIGAAPVSSHPSLLTPVDFVVDSILGLSRSLSGTGGNFHLVNPCSPSLSQLFELLAACGFPLRLVEESRWEEEVTSGALPLPQNPLAAYVLFLPRHVLSQSATETQMDEFCRNTIKGLFDTGVTCPAVDRERMRLYLDYFVRTGFLPPSGS